MGMCITVCLLGLWVTLFEGRGKAVQSRMIDDGKKIFNELCSCPAEGSMVIRMSRNPKAHIPSRNIKMDYHYKEVEIHCPKRRKEEHLQEKPKKFPRHTRLKKHFIPK